MSDDTLRSLHAKIDTLVEDVATLRAREEVSSPETARRLASLEERVALLERAAVLVERMAQDVHEISRVVKSLEVWRAWVFGAAAALGAAGGLIWEVIRRVFE